MHIRKLTIRLPATVRDTAEHEARAIGTALGQALWDNGGAMRNVTIDGRGHRGALLATRVAGALPKSTKGGNGHGG